MKMQWGGARETNDFFGLICIFSKIEGLNSIQYSSKQYHF